MPWCLQPKVSKGVCFRIFFALFQTYRRNSQFSNHRPYPMVWYPNADNRQNFDPQIQRINDRRPVHHKPEALLVEFCKFKIHKVLKLAKLSSKFFWTRNSTNPKLINFQTENDFVGHLHREKYYKINKWFASACLLALACLLAHIWFAQLFAQNWPPRKIKPILQTRIFCWHFLFVNLLLANVSYWLYLCHKLWLYFKHANLFSIFILKR